MKVSDLLGQRALIVIGLWVFAIAAVACGRAPGDLGGVDRRDPEVGGGVGFPGEGEILMTPGLYPDTSPRLNSDGKGITLPPASPTAVITPATPTTAVPTTTASPSPQVEAPAGNAAEPSPDVVPEQPAPEETPTAGDGERIHIVVAGENLYRIGLQYGLSWVAIADFNGLTDPNQISVGQELRIPPAEEPAETDAP